MMVENKPLSIPRNGLVGEWNLDGNALDSNDGTKNDGTATNVTYANTSVGYQKQAGVFNGSSSKVDLPAIASISQSTVSLWVRGYTSGYRGIFCTGTSGSDFYYLMFDPDRGGTLQIATWTGSSLFYNTTTSFSGTSNYFHIAVTKNGASSSVYVNGKFENSGTLSSNNVGGSLSSIGYVRGNNSAFFNGEIQGVRLYDKILTSQEIQTLYLEGKRMIGNSGQPDLFKDCIAYYDFKGDANDVIGGNNGTVNGATLTTDRFGIANSAYSFNGSSYITGGTGTAITGDFTIEAVTQFSSLTGNQMVASFGEEANGKRRCIWKTTGTNLISFNGYNSDVVGTVTATVGTVYHIVISRFGSTVTIYVNGVASGSGTPSLSSFTSTALKIGANNANGENHIGTTEYVKLHSYGMGADEVKALYQASISQKQYQFTKRLTGSLTQGLRAYIDGSVIGTTAYDQSGNGNNGTLDASQTVRRRFQSKALVFTATDKISFPNTNGIRAVSAWIYPTANDKTIVTLSSGKTVSVNSSNVITSTLTNPTYYVNGKVGVSVPLNKWSHIIVTFDSENSSSGSFGSDSFVGEMGDMGILTSPVNLEQAQNLFYPTYLQ